MHRGLCIEIVQGLGEVVLRTRISIFLAAVVLGSLAVLSAVPIGSAQAPGPSAGVLLASGLAGSIGSAIGPDGALYVPESAIGVISRIDPVTGAKTTAASGLPASEEGGAIDVAFLGGTLYVLTTGVEAPGVVGIYRVNVGGTLTVIADIGAYNIANPMVGEDFGPTGNPFSLEVISSTEFLVVDANFNRLLRVGLNGSISVIATYGNVVPTGAYIAGGSAYLSHIGPFPHLPETGKVTLVNLATGTSSLVAGGVPYLIDVVAGPGGRLFVLSFGEQPEDFEGPPAVPFSGKLLVIGPTGLQTIVSGLMLPTSLNIVGDTAFVVTLAGEAWRIDGLSALVAAAAAVTPAPGVTPTPIAPATGSGTSSGGSAAWLPMLLVTVAMLGAGATVAAVSMRRR
jgi:hypothetical protein